MTKRQIALLDRLEAWFTEHSHASSKDAARELRMPPEATQAVVTLGISAGRFILIGDEVYTLLSFGSLVSELQSKFGDHTFQPRELREALGESRTWIDQFADVLGKRGLLERFPGGWRLQQGE